MSKAPQLETVAEATERAARQALEACDGHVVRAAEKLGISKSTLYKMIQDGKVKLP